MPPLRRSNRRRRRKHKVSKHKFDYLGAQIYDSKVRKHVRDQIANNMTFECKLDRNMLDQLGHVQIAELKPDLALNPLPNNQFGPGVMGINTEIVIIPVGEDVATEIMSLSGNGWAVCVMSAHGDVSNVTLSQGPSSRGTATYEGYFQMLSLCGSYQPSETDGMSCRTGGLGITLAGPGGRPFGGGVAGPLAAASPVQVVIGRFPVDEKKKLSASSSAHGSTLTESSSRPGSAAN